jgi:viroplasmin and RNaseH domain-containing protein
MAETTTVTDHINIIKTLFSQLTTLDQQIKENECLELLLKSLPNSYDQLIISSKKDRVQELKAQLAREFDMKNLGQTNKILGMQIHRDRNKRKIWLSKKNYLKKILRRFNM